jgi:hypothetical protein
MFEAVVFEQRELVPTAVLELPVVLHLRVLKPIAVLATAVVS